MKRYLLSLILPRITIIGIILSVTINVFCQEKVDGIHVIPVSPNAASLGKYVEIPVSQYTGVPQINIPLQSLQSKKLKLDLSLSYHASGFRVDEDASWVGLGWSLNAGGVITRVVRGETDSKTRVSIPEYENMDWNYINTLAYTKWYDNQPDLYYYNFNGLSGKFILNDSGDAIALDENNLKITPVCNSTNDITGWKILSDHGDKYVFGENSCLDYTDSTPYFPGNLSPYDRGLTVISPTAYYLTTIKSADLTDSIKFTYDAESYAYFSTLSTIQAYTITGQPEGVTYCSYSRVWVDSKRLKNISCPNWEVSFETALREDLNNSMNTNKMMLLSKVKIKDNKSTLNKVFKFYTSYFQSDGLASASIDEKYRYMRLRLDSVSVFSSDEIKHLNPYKFSYTPTNLPCKNSTAQDLWGFYNGATTNPEDMLPNISGLYIVPLDPAYPPDLININGGSNRNPNEQYMKACMISDIKYPTGGTHHFEFESNQYRKGSYSLSSYTIQAGINSSQLSDEYFEKNETYLLPSDKEVVDLYFEFRRGLNYSSGYGICNVNGVDYRIDLNSDNRYQLQDFQNSYITSGNNVLKVGAYHGLSTLTIRLKDKAKTYGNAIAGGLRIRQITLSSGTQTKTIDYSYAEHNLATLESNGKSSGYLVTEPMLISSNQYKTEDATSRILYKQYLYVHTSPLIELGSTQGGFVGYKEVKTTYNQGLDGYELYYFTSPENYPDLASIQHGSFDAQSHLKETAAFQTDLIKGSGFKMFEPFVPLSSQDFRRGLLAHKIILNNNKKYTSEELYDYNLELNNTFRGISTLKRYGPGFFGANYQFLMLYFIDFNIYQITLGVKKLTKKTVNTFSSADQSFTSKEYNYTYKTTPLLLSSEQESGSDGTVLTSYKYPHDYSETSSIQSLKTKNIIASPLDVRTYSGTKLTSGTQTKYNDYGMPADIYRFETNDNDVSFNANNPYSFTHKQGIFYNSNQQVERVSPDNNFSTYYIWAYNKIYPIAKIETSNNGISISQLQSNVDALTLSISQDRTLIDSDIQKIKTAISSGIAGNDQVTIYTYKPLVGLTSQTDPAGRTTYYEYDDFGRLKLSKDQDGNILKKYDYHYAGQ